jgi:hypothetical protein
MDVADFATRTPVNRVAARVTSQRFVVAEEEPLTRKELREIVAKLRRKHQLLKLVLNIKSKAQHVNLLHKYKRNIPNQRTTKEPRAVAEYKRVGEEIQKFSAILLNIRRENRRRLEASN